MPTHMQKSGTFAKFSLGILQIKYSELRRLAEMCLTTSTCMSQSLQKIINQNFIPQHIRRDIDEFYESL